MIYRDDHEALALRLANAQRRVDALSAERDAMVERFARARHAVVRDEGRLAYAGDGAGHPCPRRDRAMLIPATLIAIALPFVLLVVTGARNVRALPVLLLLAMPGLLAAGSAWPYRRHRGAAVLFGVGLALAAAPLVRAIALVVASS
ncbi:MAG: hypothetical protein KC503_26850 [Myxococcales bacterium]|nr:hypothetical protein [Myxococcales bacterium]